ncbi:MAG: hypothetical protein IPM45_01335 [Acidimicrobiales bacterium]|nr:hypothetical protein [Acidimicrobiales bacterium]
MATVRATCDHCGDVEFASADVLVRVCAESGQGTYVFRCPGCGALTVKDAAPHVVDLLAAAGADLTTWHLPAELSETRVGPPICHDDLLEFHTELADEGWFARLEAMIGR